MGGEFGQPREWDHHGSLPWHLADEPRHAGVRALVRDLNRLYREHAGAASLGSREQRLHVAVVARRREHSALSFLRKNGDEHAVVVLNFTPVPRPGYRVGVPRPGRYREILNSDSRYYGGSNSATPSPTTEPMPCMEQPHSIVVTLPPLGGIVLVPN